MILDPQARLDLGRVLRRELRYHLRSKAYWISSTLLALFVLAGFLALGALIQRMTQGKPLLGQIPQTLQGEELASLLRLLGSASWSMLYVMVGYQSLSLLNAGQLADRLNRVLEVLLASVAPSALLWGKVLAMTILTLIQLALWATVFGLGAWLLGPFFGLPTSVILPLILAFAPWLKLALATLWALGAYVFLYSLVAAVGSSVSSLVSAMAVQLLALVLILPLLGLPAWALLRPATLEGMGGFLLSLLPQVGPVTFLLRPDAPGWQTLLSLTATLAGAAAVLWGATRAFEIHLLLYGRRVSPRLFWHALRGRPS